MRYNRDNDMEKSSALEKSKWFLGIRYTSVVFVLFSFYLSIRRGYYNLYIINKVFGSTAAVVAGLTLLIGPLGKRYAFFARLMPIRRHLGLLSLFFGLGHAIISAFFQPQKFPLSWYQREWIPVLFGIVALVGWLYLAYLSTNKKIQEMGADLWKKHQSIVGQIAFVAIFLHLVIMKYEGWMRWFSGETKQTAELLNPSYPPASLFVLVIMFGVIVYRVLNFFSQKAKNS